MRTIAPAFAAMAFITLFFVCLALPVSAHAQGRIAIVDVQRLMNDSKAAVSIQKQLDSQRDEFQKEFVKIERQLQDKERVLIESQEILNADEFSQRRVAFEQELLEARKLVQKRQRALEESANEAVMELRREVTKIIADIAAKEKYQLVLTRHSVLLADKDMDITDTVLSVLDKSLKSVKLKVNTN